MAFDRAEETTDPLSIYPWLMPHPLPTPVPLPGIRDFAVMVAEREGLKLADLRGESKLRLHVHARHEAMTLAHETGRFSNRQIGNYYGGRDPSTVTHARQQTEKRRDKLRTSVPAPVYKFPVLLLS